MKFHIITIFSYNILSRKDFLIGVVISWGKLGYKNSARVSRDDTFGWATTVNRPRCNETCMRDHRVQLSDSSLVFCAMQIYGITAILNVNSVGVAPIILMIIYFDPSVETWRYLCIYTDVLVIYDIFKSTRCQYHCSTRLIIYSSFFRHSKMTGYIKKVTRCVALEGLQCHLRDSTV